MASQAPTYRELFSNRVFSRLFAGSALSMTGDAFTRVALPIYVFQLTGEPIALAAMFAVQSIPWVIVGPFAGVLADRLNRKTLWLGSILAEGFAILGLIFVEQLWLIYLLALVGSISRVVQAPARSAAMPDIVGQKVYPLAVSAAVITIQTIDVVGSGVAGLFVALFGAKTAFAFDTVTFLVNATIVATATIPQPDTGDTKEATFLEDLREGFAFIRQTVPLRFVVTVMMIRGLMMIGTFPLFPAFVTRDLLGNAFQFGLLSAAASAGHASSSVLASRYERKFRPFNMLTLWSVMAGVLLLPFLVVRFFPVLLLLRFASAVFYGAGNLVANVQFARLAPSSIRGRVISTYQAGLSSSQITGSLAFGAAAGLVGASTAIFVGSAALAVLIGLLGASVSPSIREAVNAEPAPESA